MFDLILHCKAFLPAKIIHEGFTHYVKDCILIESVHRFPHENSNSAGKP